MQAKPRIAITYCTQCHWLLRAAWMAQELLSTFSEEIGEVALRPATGGAFQIELDGDIIWERRRDGGFPDVKTLKQRVRDRLAPGRDLGHIDADHNAATGAAVTGITSTPTSTSCSPAPSTMPWIGEISE